jgi:hypothetical protein
VRLITAHRILIAVGIAFFLFYAIFQGRRFAAQADPAALVQAVASLGVAIVLVVYYRGLAKRWNRPS